MSQSIKHIRTFFPIVLILSLGANLFAQGPRKQVEPTIVFQYLSLGVVRFELHDAMEGQDKLTCTVTQAGGVAREVSLTESEGKHLKSLLQNLKKESYSLSLPAHGVVVIADGELVEIELNTGSLQLSYRDEYENAKSHKPVKALMDWIHIKFPTITPAK